MIILPILLNGDYKQVVGKISIYDPLEKIYKETNHLVINPILRKQADGTEEIICFSVYPATFEPERKPKKRGRPKKT